MESNHSIAQQIFVYLSEQKYKQKYIKSLAKYQYTQARLTSYLRRKQINIQRIEPLMKKFANDFSHQYLPPIDTDKKFYSIYPSKELKDLIQKEQNQQKRNKFKHRRAKPIPLSETEICTMQCNYNNYKRKVKPQKTLLIMDYDDTLIPTTMLKSNQDKMKKNNLDYQDIKDMNEYLQSLNNFMDTILNVFNHNLDKNIFILTNATNDWVFNKSMVNFGGLFKDNMISFRAKLALSKIEIISTQDNEKMGVIAADDNDDGFKNGLKLKCMEILMEDYFEGISSGNYDVKIISIGGEQFNEARDAYNNYLRKLDEHVLNKINVSLHRFRFIQKPTWKQLTKELRLMAWNIEDIVRHNHVVKDYIGTERKDRIVMKSTNYDKSVQNEKSKSI